MAVVFIKGIEKGEAPSRNYIPYPLMKGRGIKGEGLANKLLAFRLHLPHSQ